MEPQISQKVPRNDNTSEKSLKQLMESLSKLTKTANKDKQSPKPSSSKHGPRKRGLRSDDNTPKITKWMKKETEVSKPQKRDQFDSKLKSLDVEKKSKEKKKPKTLTRSSSFDKYGIVIPSFEKIVSDQKMFEKHKEAVLRLDAFDETFVPKTTSLDCSQETQQFSEELLDCTHLSNQDLDRGFKKHLKTLVAIKNGGKYSQRHDSFHKNDIGNDLRCSTSMVVFTQDQKEHLLDLLRVELDPEEKSTSYFFKVLLPELCLRIFKDAHKMSKREASDYLVRRPLDI